MKRISEPPAVSTLIHPVIDLQQQRPFRFNEIWHNDEPFIIEHVSTIKRGAKCATCTSLISKAALAPFNIVLAHMERYLYPEKDEQGNIKGWVPTINKMGKKYYCVKRTCLLERHPYFWVGSVREGDVNLEDIHRSLLKEEIDYDP